SNLNISDLLSYKSPLFKQDPQSQVLSNILQGLSNPQAEDDLQNNKDTMLLKNQEFMPAPRTPDSQIMPDDLIKTLMSGNGLPKQSTLPNPLDNNNPLAALTEKYKAMPEPTPNPSYVNQNYVPTPKDKLEEAVQTLKNQDLTAPKVPSAGN